jgi:uncharacterized protein (DUF433 family)
MMNLQDRISVDPKIMFGKPCIRGTRVKVETILLRLSEGASYAELLADFPHIQEDDIRAALAYAHALLAHEEIIVAAE